MPTVEIQLSEQEKMALEAEMAASGFSSIQDYLLTLVAKETKRKKAWADIESRIKEGINSGPPIEATKDFWAQLHHDVEQGQTKASLS